MSLLTIHTYPDPVLKEKAKEVGEFGPDLSKLVQDMLETMYVNHGIGLAAPQVGVLKRVIVVDVSETRNQPHHFINPTIVSACGSTSSEEGCLSVPDYRETVKRNKEITVRAFDSSGKQFELKAEDLLAICIQHEMDHLEGILFVDKLSRLKREIFKRWYKKQAAA